MKLVHTFTLADAEANQLLGAKLADVLRRVPGAMFHLRGDLGAGKTTLARGLLRALGITGPIKSPTYTLMEPYEFDGARPLLHLDLYRLNSPLELRQLGLEDFPPSETLWLVEWPEKGEGVLPPPDLELRLHHEGATRRGELLASARLQALLEDYGLSNWFDKN